MHTLASVLPAIVAKLYGSFPDTLLDNTQW